MNFHEENIKNIIGHSKGLGFNYEDKISDENTDHEWNAVKINNKWCLIDSTWGAGSIIGGAYVPHMMNIIYVLYLSICKISFTKKSRRKFTIFR